jgi:hypothetical protein
MAELLSARKVRQTHEVQVDLGDDTFIRARKEDMTLLVFEGRVPMPLLAAVQKMIDMPNASALERVEALGAEHGRKLIDILREHACKVSLEPQIVMTDDGDPDHLPVAFLDTQKLLTIWIATAVVPEVTPIQAATFRAGASSDVAPAVPVGQDLPKDTQRVDSPEVEFISG